MKTSNKKRVKDVEKREGTEEGGQTALPGRKRLTEVKRKKEARRRK